jgi:hypothetical protein
VEVSKEEVMVADTTGLEQEVEALDRLADKREARQRVFAGLRRGGA